MAKKELSEFDIMKKEYSNLVKINQKLKNISDGYYISHDGNIFMSSLVSFIEKFIHLHNPDDISHYLGSMIMPNAFFEFTKVAKKTKLTIVPTEKGYHFGQDYTDDSEFKYFVNVVNPNKEIDMNYVDANIKPKMYKRFFELSSELYVQYDDNDKFYDLTPHEVESIVDAKPVYFDFNGTGLILTKQLFLDIKKDDTLSIARLCYQKIGDNEYRVFYMIKHTTDLYDSYTIFNVLQSRMIKLKR